MKRIYWTGICFEERIEGIQRIQDCINQYGAIIDFSFFSDISLSMVIEIEERRLLHLYGQLKKIIDDSCNNDLESDNSSDCQVLFNITFTRGTGNMRFEVPSVPG